MPREPDGTWQSGNFCLVGESGMRPVSWEGTSFIGLTTPSGLGHPPACRGDGQETWDGVGPWSSSMAQAPCQAFISSVGMGI